MKRGCERKDPVQKECRGLEGRPACSLRGRGEGGRRKKSTLGKSTLVGKRTSEGRKGEGEGGGGRNSRRPEAARAFTVLLISLESFLAVEILSDPPPLPPPDRKCGAQARGPRGSPAAGHPRQRQIVPPRAPPVRAAPPSPSFLVSPVAPLLRSSYTCSLPPRGMQGGPRGSNARPPLHPPLSRLSPSRGGGM